MPPEIAKMAREVMRDPVEIKIAVSKPAEKIDQSIYICRDNDKTPILKHIFSEGKPERALFSSLPSSGSRNSTSF